MMGKVMENIHLRQVFHFRYCFLPIKQLEFLCSSLFEHLAL